MLAMELLLHRRSMARLIEPAPSGDRLENIIQAGLRAPDHGGLTPWEFVIIEGEGLARFASLLTETAQSEDVTEAQLKKLAQAPFRAPMIIAVVAKVNTEANIPAFEQYLSAGCAVQAMQMAAVAQGFQGIWRSGQWMFHPKVAHAFGAQAKDKLVGFLYLGTPAIKAATVPLRQSKDFVRYW